MTYKVLLRKDENKEMWVLPNDELNLFGSEAPKGCQILDNAFIFRALSADVVRTYYPHAQFTYFTVDECRSYKSFEKNKPYLLKEEMMMITEVIFQWMM